MESSATTLTKKLFANTSMIWVLLILNYYLIRFEAMLSISMWRQL